jgi:hypothetical protein
MDTILIALAFLGVLAGLIIVGMMVTMYFYSRGALGFPRFRRANGLRALTARSVPFQVTTSAGQSEISLGWSCDPGTRYARGSMLITAIVLLMFVAAVISALSALIH